MEIIEITEKPTIEELSKLDLSALIIKRLRAGQRAKKEWLANLRLVVSVAKNMPKEYGIIRFNLRGNNRTS